jgi:hypothetical protein
VTRFLVVGGGCYGTTFAQRLARAVTRGRLAAAAIVAVDRDPACRLAGWLAAARPPGVTLAVEDWESFFARELAAIDESSPDQVVPAPLAPHLLVTVFGRWAAPRATRLVEPSVLPATPYARWHPAGAAYLSHAEWTCPVNCIEPATCPATRQPRDWEIADAVGAWAQAPAIAALGALGPFVFRCRHFVEGVATFPAAEVARARATFVRALAGAAGAPVRAAVATVSGCHGALSVLEVAP